MLDNIPQRITVVIGETDLTMKELSSIGEGSLITLNSKIREDVEIRANDVPIALGEIITIDDNFGVRVIEVLSEEKQKSRMTQGKRVFLTDIKHG